MSITALVGLLNATKSKFLLKLATEEDGKHKLPNPSHVLRRRSPNQMSNRHISLSEMSIYQNFYYVCNNVYMYMLAQSIVYLLLIIHSVSVETINLIFIISRGQPVQKNTKAISLLDL